MGAKMPKKIAPPLPHLCLLCLNPRLQKLHFRNLRWDPVASKENGEWMTVDWWYGSGSSIRVPGCFTSLYVLTILHEIRKKKTSDLLPKI